MDEAAKLRPKEKRKVFETEKEAEQTAAALERKKELEAMATGASDKKQAFEAGTGDVELTADALERKKELEEKVREYENVKMSLGDLMKELSLKQKGIESFKEAHDRNDKRLQDEFKEHVRKLKGLGLTISHSPGYELSPRGVALYAALV